MKSGRKMEGMKAPERKAGARERRLTTPEMASFDRASEETS